MSPDDDIITGYIEEVRTYIPELRREAGRLQQMSDAPDAAAALYRLAFTIRGASFMVGLPGLSRMALEMENALADMQAGKLDIAGDSIGVLDHAVNRISDYCDAASGKGAHARDLLSETVIAFRRLRGLSADSDAAALAAALDTVPEIEGGAPENADAPEPDIADDDIFSIPVPELPAFKTPELPDMSGISPELLESFYEEAREHLEILDTSLNTLDSGVTDVTDLTPELKEIIRQIRRSVHTLKGASSVIGLTTIAAWGHTMEDFLDWLYEDASRIAPETVALLVESQDLMARILETPGDPRTGKAEAIRKQYERIICESRKSRPECAIPEAGNVEPDIPENDVPENLPGELMPRQLHTLRVGAERVDDMVNIIGELMIVASTFDQQIHILAESLAEMEWSRNRIRETARNMEMEYEVRALEKLPVFREPDAETFPDRPVPHTPKAAGFEEFDSLELDRYSELNLIIRTLNESVIDISGIYARMSGLYTDLDMSFNRQKLLLSDLQDRMMRVRMLPLGTYANKLRRTVREVSKILRKKVRMVIEGENIELDRLIWDRLTDPLMHLLRNAVDHGIEMPEIRNEKGKAPVATLKLAASHEGNQVVIRISDDGAGLDYDAIYRRAVKTGLLKKNASVPDEELAAMIFRPGFSTRNTVSEVSGRGVGMDVVRENVMDIKGTVQVASWTGKGTRFTIRIPLTLAAVRALLFVLNDLTFAIALNEVHEIIRVEPQNLISKPRRAVRTADGLIPAYSLKEVLGLRGYAPVPEHPLVLIVEVEGKRRALEVDRLAGQREIVIKSTGAHLRYVRGISGVTIVGDGSVVPILNVAELIGQGAIPAAEVEAGSPAPAPVISKPLSILVVDDSVSIRQVVSRLMEEQGWVVRTARDGVDALEKVRQNRPDLIVLDIEMPRMNGYEFLGAIGADPALNDIPVVMLTSRATGKHQERARSLGAKGFVFKPYNNNDFVDLILNIAG